MGAIKRIDERPRELRRRVALQVRLSNGVCWTDARILNVSSSGLMVHSALAGMKGTIVEIRRGEHTIIARVVWREGHHAGLHSEDRVPVEEMLLLSGSQSVHLVASDGALVERRRYRRSSDASLSRLHGRALEFGAVILTGFALAGSGLSLLRQSIAAPLSRVSSALSN